MVYLLYGCISRAEMGERGSAWPSHPWELDKGAKCCCEAELNSRGGGGRGGCPHFRQVPLRWGVCCCRVHIKRWKIPLQTKNAGHLQILSDPGDHRLCFTIDSDSAQSGRAFKLDQPR